jgi:hypothetical protein
MIAEIILQRWMLWALLVSHSAVILIAWVHGLMSGAKDGYAEWRREADERCRLVRELEKDVRYGPTGPIGPQGYGPTGPIGPQGYGFPDNN